MGQGSDPGPSWPSCLHHYLFMKNKKCLPYNFNGKFLPSTCPFGSSFWEHMSVLLIALFTVDLLFKFHFEYLNTFMVVMNFMLPDGVSVAEW
jgi:hypothetical protein